MTFTTCRRLLAAGAAFAVFSGADPAFAAPAQSDKPADPEVTVQAPNGLPVDNCVPEPLRRHTISFRAPDGVRISGLALGSGRKGVVLEHEHGWTICSWLPFAQILAGQGYQVVLLEARDTGASAAVDEADNKRWDRDVLAASQELTRRGATAIVAGGASLGGTAAATACAGVSRRTPTSYTGCSPVSVPGPSLRPGSTDPSGCCPPCHRPRPRSRPRRSRGAPIARSA